MADNRKIVVNKGFMKFVRLGALSFKKQDYWDHAPERKGLWAFPFPFYDEDFTVHKYFEHMPKVLEDDDYEKWMKDVGKKTVRIREFWYSGFVYTHLGAGDPEGDNWWQPWKRVHVNELAESIRSSGRLRSYVNGKDGVTRVDLTSGDSMEIFIPQGQGILREGARP